MPLVDDLNQPLSESEESRRRALTSESASRIFSARSFLLATHPQDGSPSSHSRASSSDSLQRRAKICRSIESVSTWCRRI